MYNCELIYKWHEHGTRITHAQRREHLCKPHWSSAPDWPAVTSSTTVQPTSAQAPDQTQNLAHPLLPWAILQPQSITSSLTKARVRVKWPERLTVESLLSDPALDSPPKLKGVTVINSPSPIIRATYSVTPANRQQTRLASVDKWQAVSEKMVTYPLPSTLVKMASEAAEDLASRWQFKVTDSIEAVTRKMSWRTPLTSELYKRFPIEDTRKYAAWTMIVRWIWKARKGIKKCHSDEISGEFKGSRFTDTHTAWRVMSEFQDDRIDRDCPMNNFSCQSPVHGTTSEIQELIEEIQEHSQSDSVVSVIDECGDALYGVMAYAKRWHTDARLAVRVWASRWKAHSMSEGSDGRQIRQAWRAFAGNFKAYKLSNQDEIRAAALKKESAHRQGVYNRTIRAMKRSEIQKA